MISFQIIGPGAVLVSGMDVGLVPAPVWRLALERMAAMMQRRIRARYENEVTAQGLRFRRNTLKWDLYKAKKGYSPNRGQMLRRIIGTIKRVDLWGISAVTPAGTAVITFDEQYLYQIQGHARWYAKNKVPGGRILTVTLLDAHRAGEFVKEVDRAARFEEARKAQKRISIGRDSISIPAGERRARTITLARTAWAAATRTAAKLRLIGRF